MADDDEDVPANEDDVGNEEETVPLDEFCRDLSGSDNRVELIAVFAHRERVAGRFHAKPSAYAARFAATHDSPTAA